MQNNAEKISNQILAVSVYLSNSRIDLCSCRPYLPMLLLLYITVSSCQGTAEDDEKPSETGNDRTADGDTLQSNVEDHGTEGGHAAEDA